jgi:hypothetical protein
VGLDSEMFITENELVDHTIQDILLSSIEFLDKHTTKIKNNCQSDCLIIFSDALVDTFLAFFSIWHDYIFLSS